jgi:hypothetical protein
MGNELIEVRAADYSFKIIDKVETLFVSDGAVYILGIDVIMANDEFGVLMILTKVLHSVL